MKITPFYQIRANSYKQNVVSKENTIYATSFCGFDRIDLNDEKGKYDINALDKYCAEYFSAPKNKVQDKRDFDKWVKEKFYEISDLNLYYSKFAPDNIDRISRLDDWKEYLKKGTLDKNPTQALLILNSITSKLSPNNHEQPPIFHSGIFNNVIRYMEMNKENSPIQSIQNNFIRLYENALRHFVISGENTVGKTDTIWVTIPSKQNDNNNFNQNLFKLKTLSNHGWCTKATHASTYLNEYDCNIYIKDGKSKVIILSKDNTIKKIQCGINNSNISYKYADEILNFIKNVNLKLDVCHEKMLFEAIKRKNEFIRLQNELKNDIQNNNQINIFNKTGISAKINAQGSIIISHYAQPNPDFTFKDLGIDENKLLKNVEEIQGNADFIRSNATVANELKRIGKDANFMYSKIKFLNSLEYIGGLANFLQANNLKILPKLSQVGERIAINSNIKIPLFKNLNKLYF